MSDLTETWFANTGGRLDSVEVQVPRTIQLRIGSSAASIPVVEATGGVLTLDYEALVDAVQREADRLAATRKGGVRPDDIEVAPFRIEALRQIQGHEVTWSDIAWRAGYTRTSQHHGKEIADIGRLKRDLGLRESSRNKQYVRYETAERLAEALALDPVDLGF